MAPKQTASPEVSLLLAPVTLPPRHSRAEKGLCHWKCPFFCSCNLQGTESLSLAPSGLGAPHVADSKREARLSPPLSALSRPLARSSSSCCGLEEAPHTRHTAFCTPHRRSRTGWKGLWPEAGEDLGWSALSDAGQERPAEDPGGREVSGYVPTENGE